MNNRWMLFVDGENLTLRAQAVAERAGISLVPGPYFERDTFVWLKHQSHQQFQSVVRTMLRSFHVDTTEVVHGFPIRSYYYTCSTGDADALKDVRKRLWELNFHPEVFHKAKGKRAKGVDIALTKDMLSHAFLGNYDVAVLMAGDGDYVPLVQEIKRLGKKVFLWFFDKSEDGMNEELRLTADRVFPFESIFVETWQSMTQPPPTR